MYKKWQQCEADAKPHGTECLGCARATYTRLCCEGCGAPTCIVCALGHDTMPMDRGDARTMLLCRDCYHCDYTAGGGIVQTHDVKWTHVHGTFEQRWHNLSC